MTAFDRLEVLDARVTGALDEIAAPARPDYLDDIFTVTARTRQRPRWTFRERWIPVDTARHRPAALPPLPIRQLLLIALLALALAAALAAYVGSQRRLPPPYGPATNGKLVYGVNGDLFVRDTIDSEQRLLVGGPGEQGGVAYSLDGALIAYDSVVGGVDHVIVANADGSAPHGVLDQPFIDGSAAWSPDSKSMALATSTPPERRGLWIAATDGSGAREVVIDNGIIPLDVLYNPADDGTLLIRGLEASLTSVDLYLIDLRGKILREYDLPGDMLYGADWELGGMAYSPDGRTIAHNTVEPGDVFRTWLVDVDGTNQRAVPVPPGAPDDYSQAWPVFSPDGRWIAMESWVGIPGGPSTNQLAIAPVDLSAPARGVGPQRPGQAIVKSWAPDASRVLFAARDALELYEADPVTGEWTRLPWNSELPDWQRTAR